MYIWPRYLSYIKDLFTQYNPHTPVSVAVFRANPKHLLCENVRYTFGIRTRLPFHSADFRMLTDLDFLQAKQLHHFSLAEDDTCPICHDRTLNGNHSSTCSELDTQLSSLI